MQINNMVLWYRPDTIRLNGNTAMGYDDASPAGNHSNNPTSPWGPSDKGSYSVSDGTVYAEATNVNQRSYRIHTGLTLGEEYTILVAGCPARRTLYPWNPHISGTGGLAENQVVGLGISGWGRNGLPMGEWITDPLGDTTRQIDGYNNAPYMVMHGVVKSGSNVTYRTPQAAVISSTVPVPSAYTGWGEVVLGHVMKVGNEGSGFPGILEVVIFDRALSQEEIEYIEGYFAYKYDSVSNLSNSHPYKTVAPVGTLEAGTGDTGGGSGGGVGAGLISKENPSIARRQVMNMTMSKAAMETASGVPQAEWKRVLALYTSEGNPKAVVSFKHSQESAPGRFRSKAELAASYTLSKVIIIKTDSTFTIVDRSELDSPESMDVEVT